MVQTLNSRLVLHLLVCGADVCAAPHDLHSWSAVCVSRWLNTHLVLRRDLAAIE